MTNVICFMENCIYCKEEVCTRDEITIYEDHVCDGGCDDGWDVEEDTDG